MMRIILGILAFTLTFGLSATFVELLFGTSKSAVKSFVSVKKTNAYSHNIKSLLTRDDRYGDIRNQSYYQTKDSYDIDGEIYQIDEYRQSINTYYIKSSSMNDSFLPNDLKYAWRTHMEAWKNQAEYVNSLQDKSYSSETTVKKYSDNTDEINKTWYQVLRIAERYGVETRSFR